MGRLIVIFNRGYVNAESAQFLGETLRAAGFKAIVVRIDNPLEPAIQVLNLDKLPEGDIAKIEAIVKRDR